MLTFPEKIPRVFGKTINSRLSKTVPCGIPKKTHLVHFQILLKNILELSLEVKFERSGF